MHGVKGLENSIVRNNISRISPICILAVVLLAPSSARPQEPPDLDALASKAASQIHKSVKSGGNKILVIDFADAHAKANALGAVLADQFADSLRKNTQGLVVIDRADYARATAEDVLAPEARADEQSAKCYCRQLGADFAVEGMIDASSDTVQLIVKVTRLSDWKRIFDGNASLPLTPELRANLPKPLTPATLSARGTKNTRTIPDEPLGANVAAVVQTPGRNGITFPACTYCPNPQFSDAAVKAKMEGTSLLSVVISAAGRPASISVTRGLPCGLNTQAIESVKEWRFKPALDPNGNPAPVRQMIEMTFHLY
jgi:TonB family protein